MIDRTRPQVPNYFWGKAELDPVTKEVVLLLPLAAHCLDVACTFRQLLELPLLVKRLERAAGQALSPRQRDRLAVLAFLHDIGKANLGFQNKIFDPRAPRAGHVRELAPLFEDGVLADAFSAALDPETLAQWLDAPEALEDLLLASWSHHGAPIHFNDGDRTGNFYLAKTRWWKSDGQNDPMQEVAHLVAVARQSFPSAFANDRETIPATPALQHRFAGLVMLADWLGSHQKFFPLERAPDREFSFASARRILVSVGLDSRDSQAYLARRPPSFEARFGFPPHPLQAAIAGLSVSAPENRLLIAESETGSGKTEAALNRFFDLFAGQQVDGLYFALPTRVAARELYVRIVDSLKKIFPDPAVRPLAVLAVPGYARVDNVPLDNLLPGEMTRWHDEKNQHQQERQWAAEHPKRFLAATVAVGTIDQALLSCLQTRHAHLRSVCLDRSLLVVDEVHASDAYMRRLLRGLLAHHVGLGGHAVLLSATLGAAARAEFLQACTVDADVVRDFASARAAPYPALTDLSGMSRALARAESRKKIRFELQSCQADALNLLPRLAEALQSGARVLVILNTVARAVAMQKAVEQYDGIANAWLFCCENVICPHHGRFAPSDRELLDQVVSLRWGKNSSAGPLLLIGTQTLEQSLDIDADWLVTDLCPADVLLQRVGRLHRHDRARPEGFEHARCTVLTPDTAGLEALLDAKGEAVQEAKKAGWGSVYEDLRMLELTWVLLKETPNVEIPFDNRRLVEGATHPERLASLQGDRWLRHAQMMGGRALSKELAAFYAAESYGKAFGECRFNDIAENATARTRLGLDTLRIRLDAAAAGPFGAEIAEITIPGHLAPKDTGEDAAEVTVRRDGELVLRYGEQYYRYSRYGLEKLDEPAD